jgi:hypothetical protein
MRRVRVWCCRSALTGTLTGFLAGDGVTRLRSRTGETVRASVYDQRMLSPAVCWQLQYHVRTADFTITTRPASVTPNAASKEYGAADPALTGTLTGFLAGDGVTASYSRIAGRRCWRSVYDQRDAESCGVLGNYNIYNAAGFTITTRPASVTPNAASKGMVLPILR